MIVKTQDIHPSAHYEIEAQFEIKIWSGKGETAVPRFTKIATDKICSSFS